MATTESHTQAGLIEPINQPGALWLQTAVAQFKFLNQCCQQVSGCCQRVSRQLSLADFAKEVATQPK
jgi:hypothetical protein